MYLSLLGFTRSKQASPNPAPWKGAEKPAVPSPPPRPPAAVCAVRAPACPLERQVWPHETSESQMLSQNRDMAGREAALFLETLTVALRTANRAAQINTLPVQEHGLPGGGAASERAFASLPLWGTYYALPGAYCRENESCAQIGGRRRGAWRAVRGREDPRADKSFQSWSGSEEALRGVRWQPEPPSRGVRRAWHLDWDPSDDKEQMCPGSGDSSSSAAVRGSCVSKKGSSRGRRQGRGGVVARRWAGRAGAGGTLGEVNQTQSCWSTDKILPTGQEAGAGLARPGEGGRIRVWAPSC